MKHGALPVALACMLFANCSDDASPESRSQPPVDAGELEAQSALDAMNDVSDKSDAGGMDVDVPDAFLGADAPGDGPSDGQGEAGCDDPCPAPGGGVTWGCQKRFMYGVNYAWHHFAGDFGGISGWGQSGVAAASQTHLQNLADMRDHGVSVVRWWVFPDFRGDGVVFDGADVPTGLGATTVEDVQAALALAEQADVYLMLCLFSFDGFRPGEDVSGIWTPGLQPLVVDTVHRQVLLDEVVRPFAAAVEASPYRHRMIAWDVINEPEWAMTGPSPYGDADYESGLGIAPVDHATMESFISDVIGVLRQESSALTTVGAAAWKWAHAWTGVDVDFYQFHMYSWINAYWPYSDPPDAYGLDGKPIVMGEFPMGALTPSDSYTDVVSSWYAKGYAGALSWQYNESTLAGLGEVKAFADAHACETRYTVGAGVPRKLVLSRGESASSSVTPGRLCRVLDGHAVCDPNR